MLYLALLHNANVKPTWDRPEAGRASLTYSDLRSITGCSRLKVQDGLQCLKDFDLIRSITDGVRRSQYAITDFGKNQFAMMPCRGIYDEKLRYIPAFHSASLRSRHTLNGMKLYFYFGVMRDGTDNLAHITHRKMQEELRLRPRDISPAIRLLEELDLVTTHAERYDESPHIHHAYRLRGVEPRKHKGTTGKTALG